MDKKKWVVILIFTLVVVIIWVAASVINSEPNVAMDPEIQKALEPVNPNFDSSIVNKVSAIIIPTPITQLSTGSAQPSPTPQPPAAVPLTSTNPATSSAIFIPPTFVSTNSAVPRVEF